MGAELEQDSFRVDGELSIRNADELESAFAEHAARNADLTIDFAGVTGCDTAVLQLICSLRKTITQGGRSFRIAALSPAMETTAAVLGLPIQEWSELTSRQMPGADGAGAG